jgi:CMP-N-acetylneuraminic acid synthetase
MDHVDEIGGMSVLGIVTARGGSKGVPRKNLRPLGGKPLLQHTAEAALGSTRLMKTILTTDDEEIANLGRRCGLDVPFLRPAELAQDDTPTLPVLQHAVRYLEARGESYDAICLLQPTTPLRRSEDIDACIDLMQRSEADCVVTVLPVPHRYHPCWVYYRNDDGTLRLSDGSANPIPRRQDLPPAYHREGSIYLTRRSVLIDQNSLYGQRVLGYVLDERDSVNIDTQADFRRAEQMIRDRQLA